MEQRNQQPNQQLNQTSIDEQKRKMSKRIKITLLALAAVLIVVGGILLIQTLQTSTQNPIPPQVQPPREFPPLPLLNLPFYTVSDINSGRKLSAGDYNTEGYVIATSRCPPCSKDAVCEACIGEHILISEKAEPRTFEDYPIRDVDFVLFTDDVERFKQGKKYRFSIRIPDDYIHEGIYTSRSYYNKFRVLGYEEISKDTQGEIDTSTWQTYRNDEFGFEVKYPEGWDVDEFFDEFQESGHGFMTISNLNLASTFAVYVYFNRDKTSLREWYSFTYAAKDRQVHIIKVGGVEALRVDISPGSRVPESEVFFEKKALLFHIMMQGEVNAYKFLNQILSTFRFVEKVIPTDKQSCEAKGGTWGRFGLAQVELCNLPTSDANKTCTDSSQCESVCVADDNILPDTKTTGKCYGWTETLGTCLNYVNNGKAGGTLCAD